MGKKTILHLKNITKVYPGVKALDNINIEFKKGKIHSIIGENGAGKSTLIKIITGAQKQSSGELIYKDNVLENNSPQLSIKNGINCVYQELNLIPYLSISENIFYGNEVKKGLFLNKKLMKEESERVLNSLGMNLDVNMLVKDIGIGNQQIVEIAKSLVTKVDILILDEPTASLTKSEIENLFNIVNALKDSGVTIIYISHRLDEILRISDEVTILRDGKLIKTEKNDNLDENILIRHMVGRDIKINKSSCNRKSTTYIALSVNNISSDYVKNISFDLKKGEILGIAGLVSSGRTELANAIFGIDKIKSGGIYIHNKKVIIKSPSDAIKSKLAYITEDRKSLGLILEMSIKDNASYSSMKKFEKNGFLDKKKQSIEVSNILSDLRVKISSLKEHVNNLSGGNQQKVVIAKWLLTDSDIIIFDEPTRGIDVGAKEEVYKIMEDLIRNGKSIIMISSEMEEIFRMSDRILVMSNGQIAAKYENTNITSEQIFKDSAKLLGER